MPFAEDIVSELPSSYDGFQAGDEIKSWFKTQATKRITHEHPLAANRQETCRNLLGKQSPELPQTKTKLRRVFPTSVKCQVTFSTRWSLGTSKATRLLKSGRWRSSCAESIPLTPWQGLEISLLHQRWPWKKCRASHPQWGFQHLMFILTVEHVFFCCVVSLWQDGVFLSQTSSDLAPQHGPNLGYLQKAIFPWLDTKTGSGPSFPSAISIKWPP